MNLTKLGSSHEKVVVWPWPNLLITLNGLYLDAILYVLRGVRIYKLKWYSVGYWQSYVVVKISANWYNARFQKVAMNLTVTSMQKFRQRNVKQHKADIFINFIARVTVKWKITISSKIRIHSLRVNTEMITLTDKIRGTQRGYSSKPLNIALLNVF